MGTIVLVKLRPVPISLIVCNHFEAVANQQSAAGVPVVIFYQSSNWKRHKSRSRPHVARLNAHII